MSTTEPPAEESEAEGASLSHETETKGTTEEGTEISHAEQTGVNRPPEDEEETPAS